MNQVKSRLAALALLDRALSSATDEELAAAVGGLSDELQSAFDHVIGFRAEDEGSVDRVATTRGACAIGRMNGTLERVGVVLSDKCLEDCITALGNAADNPSQDQLLDVLPGLAEIHGTGIARLMLAAAVVGEAPASPACIQILKNDEHFALPPVDVAPAKALRPEFD